MLATTSAYNSAISASVRKIKAKVELYNGSTLVATYTQADKVISFDIQRVGEDGKFFGFGICQKLTLKLLDKEHLIFPTLIFYGLSMGTISMVIYQRMYMLLTLFIMLYFYLSLKLYKNDFVMDKKLTIQLGVTTILGFLTQYFFAFYAFFIFAIMLTQMIKKKKDKKIIRKYVVSHIVYGALGILIFVPCIKHLLFSDRGLSNLGNSNYWGHMLDYIKHLSYAFTINNTKPPLPPDTEQTIPSVINST